jgi:hypothetical protein
MYKRIVGALLALIFVAFGQPAIAAGEVDFSDTVIASVDQATLSMQVTSPDEFTLTLDLLIRRNHNALKRVNAGATSGVFVLAAFGKFANASQATKYLTLVVVAATGILAIISQYAAIREAEALLADLNRLNSSSELTKKIAGSRSLLSLAAVAIAGLGIAVFALVAWTVLG